jgi:hypothetical protein
MNAIRMWMALVALAAAAGCAGLRAGEPVDPAADLEVGLEALEQGDYTGAYEVLYPLYRRHWDLPLGQRALLALTAAELDPRNENRRLWSSADLASHYLQIPESPDWTVPVARTLYLVALELGATEERIAQAEAERDRAQADAAAQRRAGARPLPSLPGPSVPARMRELEGEREELRRQLEELQQQLAQRERQLRESEQELERIRRTIRG